MAFFKNIFEDKEMGEYNKAARWLLSAYILLGIFYWFWLVSIFPISYWINHNFDNSVFYSHAMKVYFSNIYKTAGFYVLYEYWLWGFSFLHGETTTIIPVIPIMAYPSLQLMIKKKNPYKMMVVQDTAKKANESILKKMKVWDGFIIVLGKFKKRFLKLSETLSVLAFAPPGTGKTVGIVVPTIFECDTVSMIVNDPKPELCYITSGYRAKIGPVFIINWGEEDDPENNIYYPSWNPLSPGTIPKQGPERDMYVDSMVNVFVQDPAGSSADPHWTKTGRNALSGFIHFIVSKCERAKINDYFYSRLLNGEFNSNDAIKLETYYSNMNTTYAKAALSLLRTGEMTINNYVPVGTWDNIPEEWVGREASIPLLLDWLNESQVQISKNITKRKEEGDQMASLADPMKEMLEDAVSESLNYGYAHRAVLELTQLANTPDKERGSILSTALTGIGIFKNQAVRQRTDHSDFTFKDLRGMVDPTDGKIKPITVYLSVNQADARALNVITGVFVELMSNFLISNPPNKVVNFKGDKIGPYPVLFVLDEFPQMPKLNAVIDGPAIGRGQKVSYLLIAQDFAQVEAGYGKEAVETLMSTTAAKILLTQNNENTARRFSEIMGKESFSKEVYKNESHKDKFNLDSEESLDSKSLYSTSDIMKLSPDKQIVLMQGYPTNPIEAESPRYYKDPDLLAKSKIPAATPIPKWLFKK